MADEMISDQPLKGLRALIIEDEYFIVDDLKRLLTRQGAYPVRLSGSVGDALEQIKKDGFEFALLDINMRGQMAFIVADQLVHHRVPFAFVSGYDRSIIPSRFDGIPNWGKPYKDREIVAGIQAMWTRPAHI